MWTKLRNPVALVVCVAYVVILHPPLIDDAYIALGYARSLATSGTWGMFPGHPANTATSPLNVLLLAPLGAVLTSYPLAARVFAGVCLWVVYASLSAVGRSVLADDHAGEGLGILAAVAVGTNPLFLSTVGLETPLVAALLCVSLRAFVEERPGWLGVAIGLTVLARMDAVLFGGILVAATMLRGGRTLVVLRSVALVTVPWFLFAWVFLGGAVPDTLFLKTVKVWGENAGYLDGPRLYFDVYPHAALLSLALLPAVPFALVGEPRVRVLGGILVLYAGATLGAYALLDPPPYHWYFAQQVVPLTIAGALGVAAAARRFGRGLLLVGAAPPLALASLFTVWDSPREEALIHTNWAPEARYAEIGRALAEQIPADEAIAFRVEPGTIAFWAERPCVDEFSDRALTDEVFRRTHGARGPLLTFLLRISTEFREDRAPIETTWTMTRGDTVRIKDPRSWHIRSRWSGEQQLTLANGR